MNRFRSRFSLFHQKCLHLVLTLFLASPCFALQPGFYSPPERIKEYKNWGAAHSEEVERIERETGGKVPEHYDSAEYLNLKVQADFEIEIETRVGRIQDSKKDIFEIHYPSLHWVVPYKQPDCCKNRKRLTKEELTFFLRHHKKDLVWATFGPLQRFGLLAKWRKYFDGRQ